MQAANEGAASASNRGQSMGIRVDLPFEQEVNPFVEQAFDHKTFFSRLQHFVIASDAFVVVPGGIGTVLEMLMIWQLLQVRHVNDVPLILVGKMWSGLVEWAKHTGSPVAATLVLRCEALLHDGAGAQQRFEAALRVDGCGPYDQARTRLVYAEWLRRHRRPTPARTQLAEALETFERIAAHGWAHRVRAELVALGGPVPEQHATGAAAQLTPQELQVVRRAAVGLSNREIAAQLFLSPRTVGYHLYKAYPKLGVSRRAQLGQLQL